VQRILIDADTGIDDSIAILYALRSKRLKVEGITTCFGNSGAARSADNCLRLIRLSGCEGEIPVVAGAECSLEGKQGSAPVHIHGKNGIGDVILPESDQKPLVEEAADFINRKAEELEGELVVVTTGRLTNLARALEKNPKLPRKVKRLVVMGGCLQTPGNVSPFAEANIAGDARAADRVFRAGFHMFLVGLDVTMKTFITGQDLDALERYCAEECKPAVDYIRKVLEFYFEFHRRSEGMFRRCVVHDPLAMLIAEDATLGEYAMIRAGVEYQVPAYNGMIVVDHRFESEMDQDEIAVCVRVDSDKAVRRLFSVFQ
jgi:purine nucleosidase